MKNISEKTIKRLTLYYRMLQILSIQGTRKISSKNFAELLSINSAKVRKDLSYFGSFGKPGVGYDVSNLAEKISKILGISKERRVVIIGAGNLGSALAAFREFSIYRLKIVALFDVDTHKINRKIRGIPCYHIKEFGKYVRKEKVEIAVISVPIEFAQEVATLSVKSGIKAILNFAPVRLNVKDGVKVNNVDLALELKTLTYFLKKHLTK